MRDRGDLSGLSAVPAGDQRSEHCSGGLSDAQRPGPDGQENPQPAGLMWKKRIFVSNTFREYPMGVALGELSRVAR